MMPVPTPVDFSAQALELASLGWHVFPLNRGAKTPMAGGRGYLDATTDPDQIRAWWTRFPDANIGIACGASGLVVLDVDPRNGGEETLARLVAKHGPLPATLEARSFGTDANVPGRHLYFCGELRKGVLGPGLDLQGAGAYVVAPPSVVAAPYEWTTGGEPEPVPAWFSAGIAPPEAPEDGGEGDAAWSVLGAAFAHVGWLGKRLRDGRRAVLCPWRHEHTGGRDYDTSTVLMPPRTGERVGWFHCSHSHCHGRTATDALNALGPDARAAADARYPKVAPPTTTPDRASTGETTDTQPATTSGPREAPSLAIVGLRGAELAAAQPPIAWLVRGVHLAPGRPTLLSAFGGSGKTFLAMDAALAIASGGSTCLAGLHVQRWGRVVHINGEMSEREIIRRYQRLAWSRGVDLAGTQLEVASRGQLGSWALTAPDARARLLATCDGAVLAVVDSFRALTPGVEENSSDVRRYLDLLLEVSDRTGCTFLVIHHEGKPASDGGTRDAVHRIRGSGAIVDACDTTWHVSTRDGVMRLEQGKVSLGERCPERRIRLVDVGTREDGADRPPGLGLELVTDETAGDDAAPPGWDRARTAIIDALRIAGGTGLNTRAIEKGRAEDGRPLVPGNRMTKLEALESLLLEGVISVLSGKRGEKVYTLVTYAAEAAKASKLHAGKRVMTVSPTSVTVSPTSGRSVLDCPPPPVFLNTGAAEVSQKAAENECGIRFRSQKRLGGQSICALALGRGHPARPFPPRAAPRRVKPQGGRISHHVGSQTTGWAKLAPCGQVVAWVGQRPASSWVRQGGAS